MASSSEVQFCRACQAQLPERASFCARLRLSVLSSRLGQDQLQANICGAIVDHIESDDVRRVLVRVTDDRAHIERIGLPVVRSIELQEQAQAELDASESALPESCDH